MNTTSGFALSGRLNLGTRVTMSWGGWRGEANAFDEDEIFAELGGDGLAKCGGCMRRPQSEI